MIRKRGFGLLEVVFAVLILTGAMFFFAKGLSSSTATMVYAREHALAEGYASELLEVFRSMRITDLNSYLGTNPVLPANPAYPPCTYVNVLDRNLGSIVNPDPNVDLGASPLDAGPGGLQANRYYQVTVVDLSTMAFQEICADGYPLNIGAGQTAFITVGVSWVPVGKTAADAQVVTMSTIIPN